MIDSYYDPEDRTIHAKKYTMEYFHELRHKEQHTLGWFDYEQYLTLLVVISVLSRTWVLALPFAAYLVFIELDATVYSVKWFLKTRAKVAFKEIQRGLF